MTEISPHNRHALFNFALMIILSIGTVAILNWVLLNSVILSDVHFLYLGSAFAINLFAIYYYITHPNAGFATIQVSFYFAFGALFPALIYTAIGIYPWPIAYRVLSQELLRSTSLMCLVFSICLHIGIIYGMRVRAPSTTRPRMGVSAKRSFPLLIGGYFLVLLIYAWVGLDIITTPRILIEDTLSNSAGPRFGVFKRVSLLLFGLTLVAGFNARNDPHPNNRRIFLWLFIIMVITLFVFVNPINSARWRLIGFVSSFLLLFFPLNSTRAKLLAFLAMLGGSILIYPLVSVLSRTSRQWDRISSGAWREFFAGGDFDGYQSMMHAVYWAQEFGHFWGAGLINSSLAFVPRKLWPEKPAHSGTIVSEWLGSSNTNLSMPLFGEAYLNFHLLGAVLILYLGILISRIDRSLRSNPSATIPYFASVVIAGNMLFITRGSLQSVAEFIWQILLVIAPIILLCRKRA
ncbi:hypothetical protein [Ruegeria lacuscaerulensis]|uniref:hypothetical protein n=1 Tax=Ruegeria lacuscaerulensis TaxID=55218 RepID=UPI00147E0AEA|nr:hypothetical protein [Ruegeria lacuscaerulensis]